MSFVAPLWLAVAAAVAAGVVIAHLFSTNVPPREVLPTVRFVPQGAPMAVLRTRRITDVVLLLLRVLAVGLLGMALAGAHVPRGGPARVVVVDVSRAVGSLSEVLGSIRSPGPTAMPPRRRDAENSVLIVVDSFARVSEAEVFDTLQPSAARGSLSAGIVVAHRAVANVTRGREDIELVIVSPVVREEVDSATSRLIALWEGPVRLVRVAAATPPSDRFTVELRAPSDDPVAASISGLQRSANPSLVRVVRVVRVIRESRGERLAADSAWARDSAGVLVLWLSSALSAVQAVLPRATIDTATAVTTGKHTVVGTFVRTHRPRDGRVIARWIDGEPAATESALGAGCVREVAIPVDAVGDMALRDSFGGVVRSLLEPCGGARDFAAVPDSVLLPRAKPSLAGVDVVTDSSLPLLLALLALGALLAEQLLRARRRVRSAS